MLDLNWLPVALRQPFQFCLFNIAWTYIVSEITGNVSQVDRVWTFLPTLYTAYFAFAPALSFAPVEVKRIGLQDRALLMFGLQFLWMCRLTYNTWRRGLFNLKDEDYRWELLRKAIPGILFKIFNLGFVAIAQNLLLFMLGYPAYAALVQPPTPLGPADFILAGVSLVLLALEFTADNQQWSFQNYKRSGKINTDEWPGANIAWTEDDRKRGFITRGLWAWSRHPNFLCEQSFWIVMTLFPILSSTRSSPPITSHKHTYTTITPFWTADILPAVLLCILFYSSTRYTESITEPKYPAYKAYQRRVAMFVPIETVWRGFFLAILGQKKAVDALVWGKIEAKAE